jgi:phage antirepressor YoqD-like protein
MPERGGNPYRPKRSLGAFGERVDEDALVRRYTGNHWSVQQCARAFGIGARRARTILLDHGVELRGNKKELDPGTVVRAYANFGNYGTVARLLGVDPERVTQILDEHGIEHDSSRWVAPTVLTPARYHDLAARAASRPGQVTGTGFCLTAAATAAAATPPGYRAMTTTSAPAPAASSEDKDRAANGR